MLRAFTGAIRNTCCLAAMLLPVGLWASPFFDVHLHYSASDAKIFTPKDIVATLDRNEVHYAAVTGSPAVYVLDLYKHAPDRIIPWLSVYQNHSDKEVWTKDDSVPAHMEKQLEQGLWKGIGELHLFARDRLSPVFRQVVQLAAKHKLPLMLHSDPAVIDAVYVMSPQHPVIWAHGGTFPYPDLLADYLRRYPSLRIDLSMRDERIAPNGELNDGWYELFVSFPDRFLVGVDTYSTQRWYQFDMANQTIRGWLEQLPDDVASKLSYENAVKLFSVKP